MPELPEVETVRRGLAPVLVGARIRRAELRRSDLRFPFPPDFAKNLQGRLVTGLDRRAKYLVARLDDGAALIAHLGMSGAFRIETLQDAGAAPLGAFAMARSKDPTHDHVILHLEGGARVIYNDPRRFGFMTLALEAELEAHPFFTHLGVEPLSQGFDARVLARLFAGRKTLLKSALLDQKLIAGLGNIYVCEALHRSGLSPFRAAGDLVKANGAPARSAQRLARAIRDVLGEAVEAGGSSLRDHRRADGSLGYFQHRFQVYGRTGEACATPCCGGTILRQTQNGRSSFFCPKCQR
ncbi:bifunctional DNA-formamidopyrimidine glycosylase/DNA-(apurinic or apyrimidinic site) lyase [uncultured Rhodoblastus sp.]|uniref:bifunctional DNA-formamidopyrimidine glycosylase/DNA-(apurinic or apyrimidinic site) lyase n=1 Tax=uncultured Rhodoblastus sp. TaxID=543037 RepID=UPI0025E4DB65|nr:bifunctional DNA-formamidopyrimidine glycosylase/DNA-(apurinic or apyrimidinic site) lyase [uncultured Rhodoblastus sp.]